MRAIVFIDGGNFYFRLKDISSELKGTYSLLDFRTRDFAVHLVRPDELIQVRYYIGKLGRERGDEKSETMYANQQRLIGKLQQQDVAIVLGQIIKHQDGTFHEKGVDVRIAVEMIRLARSDMYDRAYLLSSDTDLVPAVEEVRSFGKEVQYVGTAKNQSFGLTKTANDTRLLRPTDSQPFLPGTLL